LEKVSLPAAGGVAARQVTEVSPLQLEKAELPTLVTLLGMVTAVSP
jgi:hypothetical protein